MQASAPGMVLPGSSGKTAGAPDSQFGCACLIPLALSPGDREGFDFDQQVFKRKARHAE